MKKRHVALMAIAMLGVTGASPAAAHEAPRLVEYFPSVEDVPSVGDTASARSVVGSATLEAIRDDPSAVDVRVGKAFPDAVRSARALSLVLPGSSGAGSESIASFGNLEIEQRTVHDYSVYGRSELAASEVSLVVVDQDVVGTVRHGSEVYEVRPLGDGLTAVYLRDTSRWPGPECGVIDQPFPASLQQRSKDSDTTTDATEPVPSSRETPAAAADSGEETTVLVAYTASARTGAGNIDALIRSFLDDTNRFYANSLIRPRIRLAHSYQTDYTQDADMENDLKRLRAAGDDYIDEAHDLRSQYGADLVALLVGRRSNWCGYARLYTGHQSNGFSVSSQTCGSYIFAHELGHNQGANHDPDTNANNWFPYGHGLCNVRNGWRTVMSYASSDGCRPRIPPLLEPERLLPGSTDRR